MRPRLLHLAAPGALVLAACAHPPAAARPATAPTCDGPAWQPLLGDAGDRATTPAPAGLQLAALAGARVAAVTVVGAPALAPSVLPLLETRPDTRLDPATVRADLRRAWALGALADARVEVTAADDGAHVAFVVAPHAAITRVVAPVAPELARLRALVGGAYEPQRIGRVARAIAATWVADGYADAAISVFRAGPSAVAGVGLCVVADRGPLVTLGELHFRGRAQLGEPVLRAALADLRPGAAFDQEQIDRAELLVSDAYWDHGFATVRVAAHVQRHGARADVDFAVTEGELYRFGAVTISPVIPPGPALPVTTGAVFSRSHVVEADTALEARLSGHARVVPNTHVDDAAHRIDVSFEIAPP